jgi:hypothetical protein
MIFGLSRSVSISLGKHLTDYVAIIPLKACWDAGSRAVVKYYRFRIILL